MGASLHNKHLFLGVDSCNKAFNSNYMLARIVGANFGLNKIILLKKKQRQMIAVFKSSSCHTT